MQLNTASFVGLSEWSFPVVARLEESQEIMSIYIRGIYNYTVHVVFLGEWNKNIFHADYWFLMGVKQFSEGVAPGNMEF